MSAHHETEPRPDGWSSGGGPVTGAPGGVGRFLGELKWLRIFLIAGAFLLSAIVGVTILPGASLVSSMLTGDDPMFSAFYLLGIVFGIAYFIGIALSFLPMLVWVVLSEAFRLRAVGWHVAAGGAVGWASWAFIPDDDGGEFNRVALDTAIAGLVAGAIYWAIAGRSAGDWRKPSGSLPAPLPVPAPQPPPAV